MSSESNRRKFLGTAAGVAAFTIVPRHVLGGPGVRRRPATRSPSPTSAPAPQGLREILPLLAAPEIQIVAVCDPNKYATGYRDWSKDGLLTRSRRALGKPDWRAGTEGVIPGGRDVGQNVVDTYYANQRAGDSFKGCAAYADFRELLRKGEGPGRRQDHDARPSARRHQHRRHEAQASTSSCTSPSPTA